MEASGSFFFALKQRSRIHTVVVGILSPPSMHQTSIRAFTLLEKRLKFLLQGSKQFPESLGEKDTQFVRPLKGLSLPKKSYTSSRFKRFNWWNYRVFRSPQYMRASRQASKQYGTTMHACMLDRSFARSFALSLPAENRKSNSVEKGQTARVWFFRTR